MLQASFYFEVFCQYSKVSLSQKITMFKITDSQNLFIVDMNCIVDILIFVWFKPIKLDHYCTKAL